jgi:hypothetical protein
MGLLEYKYLDSGSMIPWEIFAYYVYNINNLSKNHGSILSHNFAEMYYRLA